MGRKLVRAGDEIEKFRRSFGVALADLVCQVSLAGEERGGAVCNTQVFVWSQRGPLTPEQLKKLQGFLVEEFGAVCTGSASLAGLFGGGAS